MTESPKLKAKSENKKQKAKGQKQKAKSKRPKAERLKVPAMLKLRRAHEMK